MVPSVFFGELSGGRIAHFFGVWAHRSFPGGRCYSIVVDFLRGGCVGRGCLAVFVRSNGDGWSLRAGLKPVRGSEGLLTDSDSVCLRTCWVRGRVLYWHPDGCRSPPGVLKFWFFGVRCMEWLGSKEGYCCAPCIPACSSVLCSGSECTVLRELLSPALNITFRREFRFAQGMRANR